MIDIFKKSFLKKVKVNIVKSAETIQARQKIQRENKLIP